MTTAAAANGKWTPTSEQRRTLEALQAEALREGSIAQFCREYATFTESKFSKILNAINTDAARSYFDDIKDPAGCMADLEDLLRRLPRLRRERELAKSGTLHKLSAFRAVAQSVRESRLKTTPERITTFIAPTGGGKTSLRQYLMHEFRNELAPAYVEARESWRPSNTKKRESCKRTVLRDIAAALGMRSAWDNNTSVAEMEDALAAFCTDTRRLLFIDEAEFFSAYALNLLKMLLNRTRLVLVIACTPRAYAKWNSYYPDEADQIARRTTAVVHVNHIKPEDAALFFAQDQFSDADRSLEYIGGRAQEFGHFSLIARTADILRRSTKAEKREVEDAVRRAQTQMGRQPAVSPSTR